MHPHMSPSPSRLRPTSRVRHTRPHVTRHTHTTRSGASPYMNAHLSIEFRPTTPKPASINKKKKRKPPLPATEEEGVPSPWLRCASLLSACVQSTQRRGRSHHHDHDPMAFMRSRSNASSGMGVAPNIRETFVELQMKKAFRYVIFKIEEKQKQVVVEKTGATTESYDDFLASLPENDCRYALYDFDFVTGENVQKSKIFFIAWSPSTSRIRAKMLYSTSKDRIKYELDGFHYEIQATDPSEVDIEVLRERAH
ncbi:Actin-depolymerizing factor 2 [Zea mays]|uniref:Actin-depolymerizing factor 2 n=3 Tax=Zea mays TaxID=4577 RepID=A0A3L6ETD5_MAIZE|nr:Actin-depolymerizing factor 2 [Zea mays]